MSVRHKFLASCPGSAKLGPAIALLVAAVVFSMLLAAPAVSQAQAVDPLAGEAARITESTEDPNNNDIVDRIVITAAGCEVAGDATVTVEDNDGTQVELTNGGNVTITADGEQVTIVGTEAGGNLGGISPTGGDNQFGTVDQTVTGKVIGSTGITCSGAGGDDGDGDNDDTPADDQYDSNGDDPGDVNNPDDVMDDTTPGKPLPKTGGIPLVLGAGVLLACATLLSARVLRS
jgi:hypothetical protein